jgi:hypothetical protein
MDLLNAPGQDGGYLLWYVHDEKGVLAESLAAGTDRAPRPSARMDEPTTLSSLPISTSTERNLTDMVFALTEPEDNGLLKSKSWH